MKHEKQKHLKARDMHAILHLLLMGQASSKKVVLFFVSKCAVE